MAIYDANGTALTSAYDANGTALTSAYDANGSKIWESEPQPVQREWLDTAIVSVLPSITQTGTKQGGCTDGTYIYQCVGDSKNFTYMKVIKYKISDGTYTVRQYDGTPNFGHANDMTYNPNTGYLYVCTMRADGSILVLDADDLSYVETVYALNSGGNPYYVWQICYDRLANCYYSGDGSSNLVYDSNWNYVRTIQTSAHPDATAQGCETDGEYFYRITYNPNLVDVCTVDGRFVKTITIPVSGEPEAIMFDWNGNYYFSKNANGDMFYRLQMFTE